MIRSCIFVFYIAVICGLSRQRRTIPTRSIAIAKRSRARRARPRSGASGSRANPKDFESAWKLARAQYWLGTNGLPERERKAALEAGIAAARKAIAIDAVAAPKATSGWRRTWGRWPSRSVSVRAFAIARPFAKSLERVLKIDAPYLDGSADRALGPLVLQSARTLWRRQAEVRNALAQGAVLRARQHHFAPVPGRDAHRTGPTGRRRAKSWKRPSRRPSATTGRPRTDGSRSRRKRS